MDNPNITLNLGTKNLLRIILVVQLVVLGLIGLSSIGIEIPFLKQSIDFVYLSFIPGILILRNLKLHNLSAIESISYSLGLSLAFLMFIGVLINQLYPLIGISKPISETPLITTISVLVFLLCFICYLRGKSNSTLFSIDIQQFLSPFMLSLLLLPFLAVFGAYMLNSYDNNSLILVLFAVISLFPIFVVFDKIPEEYYPLILWLVSITLLIQHTLVTTTVASIGDASVQAYAADLVITGVWNPHYTSNLNGQLSVVMLIPIFSIILEVSPIWVLKVIYPLILSILPLGSYYVFLNRTANSKIAFISSFLLISAYPFFEFLSFGMRQGIAEIFLVLLLLLITNKSTTRVKKALLSVVFGCSMAVSHDGVTYILLFVLVFAIVLRFATDKIFKNIEVNKSIEVTTFNFTSLLAVFSISWFMLTTKGIMLNRIILLYKDVINSIEEFMSPEHSFSLYIIAGNFSLSLEILRVFYIIVCFLIAIGVLSLFHRLREVFDEYNSIALSFFLVIFFLLFTPELGIAMFGHRITHLMLIILAPFCIKGGSLLVNRLTKIATKTFTHVKSSKNLEPKFFKGFSLFLMIFLLLNSGFVSEIITKDYFPPTVWLSKTRIMQGYNVEAKSRLLLNYLMDYDVFSAQWLSKNRMSFSKIFLSEWTIPSLFYYIVRLDEYYLINYDILRSNTQINKGVYVYLTYLNNVEGIILRDAPFPYHPWYNTSDILPELEELNKIYDNGGSTIYYS